MQSPTLIGVRSKRLMTGRGDKPQHSNKHLAIGESPPRWRSAISKCLTVNEHGAHIQPSQGLLNFSIEMYLYQINSWFKMKTKEQFRVYDFARNRKSAVCALYFQHLKMCIVHWLAVFWLQHEPGTNWARFNDGAPLHITSQNRSTGKPSRIY